MKSIVWFANRPWFVVVVYGASLMVSALLFAHFEGKSVGDGLWWSVVTALTIGYGDLSPATTEMRTIAAVFQHFWIFLILPVVIATVLGAIIEDRNRFTHEEQEWTQNALEKISGAVGVTLPPQPRDY